MIRAAGGVPWRLKSDGRDGDIEIAIVHRPRYDDWSLPKGKLDASELPLLAAVREVSEETGLTTRVGRRLITTSYRVAGEPKTVEYWAMQAVDGEFIAGDEVDELRWLSPAEAKRTLTSPLDPPVVDSLLAVTSDTTTVLLVRHARAGNSRAWKGDDALRPLDEIGCQQAESLAELLPVYRPTRVLAADRVRCIDSVRPLAERLAVALEIDPDFSEHAHAKNPKRVASRLRSLAALGEPVVVCSQGGVIPDSLLLMARRDRVRLPGKGARKGSFWALHFIDDRLAAADYYPRPGQSTAAFASTKKGG